MNSRHGSGFQWKEADAYLFDIDGTLLLSPDRTHRYALYRAMRDVYGVDTTIDGIAFHGKTDPGILQAALERAGVTAELIQDKMKAALEVVRQDAVEKADRFRPQVLPGIRDLLSLLHGSRKLLGVCSGNLEVVGWLKLKAAGLAKYFDFGCFADECELRLDVFRKGVEEVARRLSPCAATCFIGDTPDDVRAAHGAGGRVIAVGTGIFTMEELAAHEPDVTVESCAELLAL